MSIKVFIDIETIPDQRPDAFDHYLEAVEPPGNYKKQETIDKWMLENAEAIAEESYLKTGLNGLHGEICSIAFAVEDRPICVVTRGKQIIDETALLQMFNTMLEVQIELYCDGLTGGGERARFAPIEWIGHNLLDFDLRFLKQRSIIRGVEPFRHFPADARHGSGHAFDTMKEWAGWRGYVKLADLTAAFGIDGNEPEEYADVLETDGSKVWELFRNGETDLIAKYNMLDVWRVREVYRKQTFGDPA